MRIKKLLTLCLVALFGFSFLACGAEEEETEVPSAQGQIDKAQAAAAAASQAAQRTDRTSAAADGTETEDEADDGDDGEEP